MSDAALALEHATVRYPLAVRAALDDVTLRVAAGECVALVGPNGAGKTTALRALLGVVPLASGSASIMGRAVASWPRAELARQVGVVAQREEPAFPVTVRDVVAMGRYPHLGPWQRPGAGDDAAIERALRQTDIAALASRWVGTLSGGEWQRVRLARALAQEPAALLLDEPASSLDLRHEMELMETVVALVRERGLAALVVSHHLNVAARFADRLVLFAEGRAVADGLPPAVLEPQLLTTVFGWPVGTYRLDDGSPQLYPLRKP